MREKTGIDVLSAPDYENLVAEVVVEDKCLLVVSQEGGFDSLDVEFVPRRDGKPWRVKYDLLMELLEKARSRLWDLRRDPPETDPEENDER